MAAQSSSTVVRRRAKGPRRRSRAIDSRWRKRKAAVHERKQAGQLIGPPARFSAYLLVLFAAQPGLAVFVALAARFRVLLTVAAALTTALVAAALIALAAALLAAIAPGLRLLPASPAVRSLAAFAARFDMLLMGAALGAAAALALTAAAALIALAAAMGGFAAFAADFRHVFAILADGLATLAACFLVLLLAAAALAAISTLICH